MKPKFSLLAVLMVAVTLALVGVLRDINTSKALIPDPVQPFLADATGGMADTTLGLAAAVDNYTITTIPRGSRTTLPWIYSGPGWTLDIDKNMDGEELGTVTSEVDALCDSLNPGDIDILAKGPNETPPGDVACDPAVALDWVETTTAVQGTGDEFLIPLVPPYSWLARHSAVITNICLYGTTPNATSSVLNTVYTSVPFSANGSAFTATTKLGGDPDIPLSDTCLDSPQSSVSITSIYHAPALEGDSDGPCDTGTYACANAAIYGMWTDNLVELGSGQDTTIPVHKVKLNNGPEDGTFTEHWEIEVTNAAVAEALWATNSSAVLNETVLLDKSVSTAQTQGLHIMCLQPGWSLVVLKNVLWPAMDVSQTQMTKDTYADDNAFVFVVKVVCDGAEGTPLVDKEVIWVKPVDLEVGGKMYAQDHLQLLKGQTTSVLIDELKANHAEDDVVGTEWLVAEVADANLEVSWTPESVTIDQGGVKTPVTPVTSCGAGCITYDVTEPPGQSDVQAQLNIKCASAAEVGLYSVVLKAIDVPKAPYGESKPSDNAQRSVIKVWCGTTVPFAPDGKEDANGLYARWTVFQSLGTSSLQIAGELRKPYKVPPSLVSDSGYVERLVDLQCFWMDDDGCFVDDSTNAAKACDLVANGGNADGAIEENESWNDWDLDQLGGIEAVDEDGDCLMNAALAQPSHPVDELDEPTGTNCATGDGWVVYSEAPNVVLHDKAADQDCDGLLDGIEKAWGSNPKLADSDGDGAKDFVEMFQQTNPLNPDTDGDGFKDAPVPYYTNNTPLNTAYDNCPGVYNPDQANNDGMRRTNGTIIGDWASNPNQDKMGDACDPDDDNDGAPDSWELSTTGYGGVGSTKLPSNPFALDSDGDTINDGAETIYKTNAMSSATGQYPTWADATQQYYYRGCHHNLPEAGSYGAYTNWDEEYDTAHPNPPGGDNIEKDVDGDGILCGGTPGDPDSDNGTGTRTAGPLGYSDKVEAFRYALGIANNDTDGDGCPDWVEITDLDGNRASNLNDVYIVAGLMPAGPFTLEKRLADLDMNLSVNINDVYTAVANSNVARGGAATCSGGETQPGGP